MPKFRKKPVIVEAVQWHGFEKGPHDLGIEPTYQHPGVGWIIGNKGRYWNVSSESWLIMDEADNLDQVCKPDIFAATYEPVEGA